MHQIKQEVFNTHPRMETFLYIYCEVSKSPGVVTERLCKIQSCSYFSVLPFNLAEYLTNEALEDNQLALILNVYHTKNVIIDSSALSYEPTHQVLTNLFNEPTPFTGLKILLTQPDMPRPKFCIDKFQRIETTEFLTTTNQYLSEMIEREELAAAPLFKCQSPAKNILLLAAHEPKKDPRLDWISKTAEAPLNIIQLGIDYPSLTLFLLHEKGTKVTTIPPETGEQQLDNTMLVEAMKNPSGMAAVAVLREFERILKLRKKAGLEQYRMNHWHPRAQQLPSLCQYFLIISQHLLRTSTQMRGLHGVIAADLETLPTALILKSLFNIPVFYDAHEYWPEQNIDFLDHEKQFWHHIEHSLIHSVDYCQTVSSTLATFMSKQYGKKFHTVPNCIPYSDIPADKIQSSTRKQSNKKCHFIFQGGFAPGRGIELLINAWPKTDENAILLLRGPDSEYKLELKTLSESTGLLDKRIFFLPPVPESKLIEALNTGDVGLVPYEPILANNTNCCPNKLSQYFAAKLPVLANNTKYVTHILHESKAGLVADFCNTPKLIESINSLTNNQEQRIAMGDNGYQYLKEVFHFEKVSVPLYEAITSMTKQSAPNVLELFKEQPFQPSHTHAHHAKSLSSSLKESLNATNADLASKTILSSIVIRFIEIVSISFFILWRLLPERGRILYPLVLLKRIIRSIGMRIAPYFPKKLRDKARTSVTKYNRVIQLCHRTITEELML